MSVFRNALICDFACRGENNKHVVAGIYSGDILLTSKPAQFRFCLYLEFAPTDIVNTSIQIDVEVGAIRVAQVIADMVLEGNERMKTLGVETVAPLISPFFEISILDNDEVKIWAAQANKNRELILRKKILFVNSAM